MGRDGIGERIGNIVGKSVGNIVINRGLKFRRDSCGNGCSLRSGEQEELRNLTEPIIIYMMAWARARKQQRQQEREASPETPRTPTPHASSVQRQQQQSESEVVELGCAGVVGAEHQQAFSRGANLGLEYLGISK